MGDATTISGPGPTAAPPGGGDQTPRADEVRRAAQGFEAVFLAQVLRVLNQDLADDLLGDAEGGVFHEMLNDAVAKLISRAGGIGVADAVLRAMLKAQEAA